MLFFMGSCNLKVNSSMIRFTILSKVKNFSSEVVTETDSIACSDGIS